MKSKKLSEAARQRHLWTYLTSRPNLLTEILFVFPVLLIYHAGTHLTTRRNGVDLVSVLLAHLYAEVEWAVLVVDAAVIGAFIALYVYARKKQKFQLRLVGPVLLESSLYALTMGTVIVLLLVKVFGLQPPTLGAGEASLSWPAIIYISTGAGFYEELIFRLVLFGGGLWLLEKRTSLDTWAAVAVAMTVSSALFALAHHIPPQGEPLAVWPLAFRGIAGVAFASLYYFRGFAVAVYTHTIYDIYVLGWLA